MAGRETFVIVGGGLTAAKAAEGLRQSAGEPYDRQPYFFTDQYDLGMEYVGSIGPAGYDEVVLRGDVRGRTFTAFWLKDRRRRLGQSWRRRPLSPMDPC